MYKTSSVTIDSGAIISGHMMPTVDCRSMAFSHRYAEVDIRSSMAHAKKLGASGLISEGEAIKLLSGLVSMLDDLKSGLLVYPVRRYWTDGMINQAISGFFMRLRIGSMA